MNPADALSILDQATEPGARLSKRDYVAVAQALATLGQLIQQLAPPADPNAAEAAATAETAPADASTVNITKAIRQKGAK